MRRYRVRIVTGPGFHRNGPELARIVTHLLERAGLSTMTASYRSDSGLVIVAPFATDDAGGALAAAAGVAELVNRALDRGLTAKGREAWARMLTHATIKAEPQESAR